jgi:hypothetical protein
MWPLISFGLEAEALLISAWRSSGGAVYSLYWYLTQTGTITVYILGLLEIKRGCSVPFCRFDSLILEFMVTFNPWLSSSCQLAGFPFGSYVNGPGKAESGSQHIRKYMFSPEIEHGSISVRTYPNCLEMSGDTGAARTWAHFFRSATGEAPKLSFVFLLPLV